MTRASAKARLQLALRAIVHPLVSLSIGQRFRPELLTHRGAYARPPISTTKPAQVSTQTCVAHVSSIVPVAQFGLYARPPPPVYDNLGVEHL